MNHGFMPQGLRILYLGREAAETSSRQRADALRRLGHYVEILNPDAVMPRNRVLSQVNFRTGYRLYTGAAFRYVRERVGERNYDIVWIDGGHSMCAESVRWLKKRARFVVNMSMDDPTGPREPSKWSTLLRAIPEYDLCVVVRDFNCQELMDLGAKKVLHVMRCYDELAHARLPYSAQDEGFWGSEVVFVGTWMPERGPFMEELIRLGVPLTIYGNKWQRATSWPVIEPHWRSASATGANYVKAIQYSKIAIGMLSKGNRDLHTQRSAEIPFIGSVFCAERTREHVQMFEDGEEAVFWTSPKECAAACQALLKDPARCEKMTEAARAKVEALGLGNEAVCAQILEAVTEQMGCVP